MLRAVAILPIQDQGVLAFASSRDGNAEIYSQNTADWGVFRLTIDPAVETQLAWSPDGSRVAFATNRNGNFETYVMKPDGTEQINLSNNPADDDGPVWSPDGEHILQCISVCAAEPFVIECPAN